MKLFPMFTNRFAFLSVIPNCQFRSKTSRLKTFTANQLDEIKDPSGLFYILPFQKVLFVYNYSFIFIFTFNLHSFASVQGYLVNWDVQRKVWDQLFGKEMFKVPTKIKIGYFFQSYKLNILHVLINRWTLLIPAL